MDRLERFMRHVDRSNQDGCWLWTGTRLPAGYGLFHWKTTDTDGIARKSMTASRASYMLHVGPVPDHLHVCHRCDNPPCVNPDHLFIGTAADNTQDMLAKYRHSKTRRPHTRVRKLSDDDVRAIRSDPRSATEIAAAFGCSALNVYNIKARRRKANVPD